MGFRASLIRKIGHLMEKTGRGTWCDAPRPIPAIYFFLFGQHAELTAWLMPAAGQIRAQHEEHKDLPRLMIVTDQPHVAQIAQTRGHGTLLANLHAANARAGTDWFKNALRVQFAQYRPMAVYFSPDFPKHVHRPRNITDFIYDLLLDELVQPPGLIGNELDDNYDACLRYVNKRPRHMAEGLGIPIFYYGDPAYLDLDQLLGRPNVAIKNLGWKPGQKPKHAPRSHAFYIFTTRPLVERELRLGVAKMLSRIGQTEPWPEIHSLSQSGRSMGGMLDMLLEGPGLVLADTTAPLLTLLGLRVPVCLTRYSSMKTQSGLVKYSFFAGPERWPVLEHTDALFELVQSYLGGKWTTELAGPPHAIEQAPGIDCRQGFIEQLYNPCLKTLGLKEAATPTV